MDIGEVLLAIRGAHDASPALPSQMTAVATAERMHRWRRGHVGCAGQQIVHLSYRLRPHGGKLSRYPPCVFPCDGNRRTRVAVSVAPPMFERTRASSPDAT